MIASEYNTDFDKVDVGEIYIDCAYHPVRCEEVTVDEFDTELVGTSLIDGSGPRCCSLKRCVVAKVTKKQVEQLAGIHKEGGERALMIHFGWTPENADRFLKEWR